MFTNPVPYTQEPNEAEKHIWMGRFTYHVQHVPTGETWTGELFTETWENALKVINRWNSQDSRYKYWL